MSRPPENIEDLCRRGAWRQVAKRTERAESQPETLQETPDAPQWLSAGARELWAQHAPVATEAGLLTGCDLLLFGLLMERLSEYLKLRDVVEAEGTFVVLEHYTGAHPAARLRDVASRDVLRLSKDCGYCPLTRGRLVLKPKSTTPSSIFAKK